jgi:hypothetical protein
MNKRFVAIVSASISFAKNRPVLVLSIFLFVIFIYYDTLSMYNNIFTCLCLSPEDMCNTQDVEPLHENRLNTVYNKLLRLGSSGDNAHLSMSSTNLKNGLVFTPLDRETMHSQVHTAYPNMLFRFTNTGNPHQFNLPGRATAEILQLFAPTNR